MSGRGRRQNLNFSKLNFKLVNKNSKYFAQCDYCDVQLKNTGAKRLENHRYVQIILE